MPAYEGRVLVNGKVRTLYAKAADAEGARMALGLRGRVIEVRRRSRLTWTSPLTSSERHTLMIRLASMVEAKVSLTEALDKLAIAFRGRIRFVAERLRDAIETGDDLPMAMDNLPEDFPPMIAALVKAGHHGVGTPGALRDAADFEREMSGIDRASRAGLWIAVGNLLLAGLIMVGTAHWFTPTLITPQLLNITGGAGEPGMDVAWISALSDLTTVVIVVVFGFLGVSFAVATLGRRLAPIAVDRMINAIPVFRDVTLGQENYITFHKLALLARSGVGLDKALTLVADSLNHGAVKTDLLNAGLALSDGEPWTEALRSLHPTDRSSLAAAQNSHEVAHTLQMLADQYKALYGVSLGWTVPMLRSFSMLIMGVAGVVMFGLTVVPVLQLAKTLAERY